MLVYLNLDSLQEDGLVQDGSALSRGGGLGVDEGEGIKEVWGISRDPILLC